MAIEGSLADVNLADICQLISMGRKTGCLTVTDRSNFGYVYFKKGTVVYASVLNRPDRLGDLLVRNGSITREQLSEAMEEQAQNPRRRLGQILVKAGTVEREEVEKYITVQIEEAVYHLFSWVEGSFHFDPEVVPNEDVLKVSINAEALLMEGARRVDEWSQIEKRIASTDLIFKLHRDPRKQEGVELTENQEKIVPLLDGSRTVDEVVEESGLVEFDACKALYGLIQAGFAEEIGRREASGLDAPGPEAKQHLSLGLAFYRAGMMEDAAREFELTLAKVPHQPRARFRMGLIAMKGGKPDEALAHFEAMPEEDRRGFGILRNMALALEELGRFDEALGALKVADSMRPGHPLLLMARGVVLLRSGDAVGGLTALEGYRKFLGKQTPPPIYFGYAVLAVAMAGDLDGAVALGSQGMAAYPEDKSIKVNLGAVMEHRGELEAAETLFLRAVADRDAPAQAYKNLGDMAFGRGDNISARAHFERAIKIDPKLGDDVYTKLGEIAYKDDDRDWALILWQRAVELNPKNGKARANLEKVGAAPA